MMEFLPRECERADSYKLLSECYYLPDQKLIRTLSGLKESRVALYSEITKYVPEINEIESLKVDYSKLFVGPYKVLAPPYGSVYLEDGRRVMTDSTIDVKNWYRRERLNIVFKEAPDHIAVELEFMYFLIVKQMQAVRDSDYKGATSYLKKQSAFLNTHLGRWVPVFAEKVEKNAKTMFYQNVTRFTESFIDQDSKSLSLRLHFPASLV
ncbi:MAG: molecular chaperone TorD family protein [Omnitrophica bacterium]|nr:molecular chaperone TorD family protein [Candidatus Omnitrophota bacterium]